MFFKLDGRHVIKRPMRSKVIVLVLKHLGYGADLVHVCEQVCVKYFGAVRAVKTLDVAILRRLTGLNELQLSLLLFSPELHVVARVLRAIIDPYAFGLTMEVNKVIQCSSDARSG